MQLFLTSVISVLVWCHVFCLVLIVSSAVLIVMPSMSAELFSSFFAVLFSPFCMSVNRENVFSPHSEVFLIKRKTADVLLPTGIL